MKRQLFIVAALTAGLAMAGCDTAEDTEPATQAESTAQVEGSPDTEQQASHSLQGMLEFAATETPLPEEAAVTVSLRDVALADAPATVITETTVAVAGNGPVEFALDYPVDKVTAHHAHDLHAEIRDTEGKLQWTTPARHSVEVGPDAEQGPVTLSLEPVAPAATVTDSLEEARREMIEEGETAVESPREETDAATDSAESLGEQAEERLEASAPQ